MSKRVCTFLLRPSSFETLYIVWFEQSWCIVVRHQHFTNSNAHHWFECHIPIVYLYVITLKNNNNNNKIMLFWLLLVHPPYQQVEIMHEFVVCQPPTARRTTRRRKFNRRHGGVVSQDEQNAVSKTFITISSCFFQTDSTDSFSMLMNGKTAGAFLKSLRHLHHCRLWTERLRKMTSSSRGSPWRLLFFGTDQFAMESLKLLTSSRYKKWDSRGFKLLFHPGPHYHHSYS